MSNCKHDLRGDSCPYCENEALRKELKEQKELAQGLEANLKACESHCEEELADVKAKCEQLKALLNRIYGCGYQHISPICSCCCHKEFNKEILSEPSTDSLTAWFREQTDEVVEVLHDCANMNECRCQEALAKLKKIRKEEL